MLHTSCMMLAGYIYLDGMLLITIHLDTQCTCVFVWLKQGVERTWSTVVQVIQNVKDALDQDIVPKDCFVSLEVNCMRMHIFLRRVTCTQLH